MSKPTLDARIDALEERDAHQEETIEQLNRTVTEQWAVIEKLRRDLAALGERLEDAVAAPDQPDRPPPHY